MCEHCKVLPVHALLQQLTMRQQEACGKLPHASNLTALLEPDNPISSWFVKSLRYLCMIAPTSDNRLALPQYCLFKEYLWHSCFHLGQEMQRIGGQDLRQFVVASVTCASGTVKNAGGILSFLDGIKNGALYCAPYTVDFISR